ncbi:hypothetical protein MHPYR_170030 [uncultured Mycobacterium sp.]|uniref:Uncharacterized protein n=1 Tax=uncultured Mycobacterium sp. TaxID=171292 RepID=A0A1Y5P446_9MYCO|nr:hypothetical protein MHPYR_170030 [uncultured Mycobacterium sp.]
MQIKARLLSNRYFRFVRQVTRVTASGQALARFFSPRLFTKMALRSLLANPYRWVSFALWVSPTAQIGAS